MPTSVLPPKFVALRDLLRRPAGHGKDSARAASPTAANGADLWNRCTGRPGAERGFTLLEVLVAFIIAAIGIAALVQGAAGGLRSAQAAAHYQEAVSRAQSRLALLQASLRPGEQRGDDGGGFSWRVVVQPGATAPRPAPPSAAGGPNGGANRPERIVLYAVAVSIAWALDGGDREVTLYSQRLGTAPPEGP